MKSNIAAWEVNDNGIINVAAGKKRTFNRLDEIIKDTIGSDLEPKYLPERSGDIKHSLADISNMEKINLKINSDNFESQLIETINWFKTIL